MSAYWTLYTERQRWRFLMVLFFVAAANNLDRNIIAVLLEPIRNEFGVSDTLLGLLTGLCFAFFYAVGGIPLAHWADRGNRKTLISVAIGLWSLMTAFCGMAQRFWQLALARVGVGIGEAGVIPPAQSLLIDCFPPERRATAIAILTSAATLGYLLGVGGGGYAAALYGWRAAFILAGLPGLLLALLAWLILDEPRHRGIAERPRSEGERFTDSCKELLRKRSFRYGLGGCVLYFAFAYGSLVFVPSFLIRVLHRSQAEVSLSYALVVAVASVVGSVGAGWLADTLSGRDVRWLAWLPACAFALTGPVFVIALLQREIQPFLVLAFISWMFLSGGFSVVFAAIHVVCGSRRRATAIAIILFAGTLLGGGLGPLATGALSDLFRSRYAVEGLRYALTITSGVLSPCAILFWIFGYAMPADREV